jgi:hypothetical protein
MSKLIHFRDQLAATSNPDPLLNYVIMEDNGDCEIVSTRKSVLTDDLVGMRFERMMTIIEGAGRDPQLPVFVSELVEA